MPTKRSRIRRRRQWTPDAIIAVRMGAAIEYSSEAYQQLIAAYYFHDPHLDHDAVQRVRQLLDEWGDLARADELKQRQR